MIRFDDWRLTTDGAAVAMQYDNKTRSVDVTGEIPAGWTWTLLVLAGDNMDLITMEQRDDGLHVLLTAQQLALTGYYIMQLRAMQGERVRHTNQVRVYIPASLSGDANWPELPSEFSDCERRVLAAAENAADSAEAAEAAQYAAETAAEQAAGYSAHPPRVGNAGTWETWDGNEYVDTGMPASVTMLIGAETAPIVLFDLPTGAYGIKGTVKSNRTAAAETLAWQLCLVLKESGLSRVARFSLEAPQGVRILTISAAAVTENAFGAFIPANNLNTRQDYRPLSATQGTVLKAMIETEAAARNDADAKEARDRNDAIQSAVSAARADTEAALSTAIETEISARQIADNTLDGKIAAEAAAREADQYSAYITQTLEDVSDADGSVAVQLTNGADGAPVKELIVSGMFGDSSGRKVITVEAESVNYNQLLRNGKKDRWPGSGWSYGAGYGKFSNGVYTVLDIGSSYWNNRVYRDIPTIPAGHTVSFSISIRYDPVQPHDHHGCRFYVGAGSVIRHTVSTGSFQSGYYITLHGTITTEHDVDRAGIAFCTSSDDGSSINDVYHLDNFMLSDLTAIYGPGNEPSHIDFLRDFTAWYHDYTTGTRMSRPYGRREFGDYIAVQYVVDVPKDTDDITWDVVRGIWYDPGGMTQVEPQRIVTMRGINRIFVDDAPGNDLKLSLAYRLDPTIAYEELQARLQAMILEGD